MEPPLRVVLEVVRSRAFAVAVDWPGWTRAGRDEEAALDALLHAGPRYAEALAAGEVAFVAPGDRAGLAVVDRLPGNAGTECGAPSVHLPGDDEPLDGAELERHARILRGRGPRSTLLAPGTPTTSSARGHGAAAATCRRSSSTCGAPTRPTS